MEEVVFMERYVNAGALKMSKGKIHPFSNRLKMEKLDVFKKGSLTKLDQDKVKRIYTKILKGRTIQ